MTRLLMVVLEHDEERMALGKAAHSLGVDYALCDSVAEATRRLASGGAWDVVLVRPGRSQLAVEGLLRDIRRLAPGARVALVGDGSGAAPLAGGADRGRVEVLPVATAAETVGRLIGARDAGRHERQETIVQRRTWCVALEHDRRTGWSGPVAAVEPSLFSGDEEALAMLRDEASRALAVEHENLARPADVSLEPPCPRITWEVPPGAFVTTLLRPAEAWPVDVAVAVAAPLAAGLGALHRAGLAHGALGSWSVWLGADGSVRLMNQGIGRWGERMRAGLTGRAMLAFREDVMAPEQVSGAGGNGQAADVYAVGRLLYRLLVGHDAFAQKDAFALMQALLAEAPAPVRAQRPEVPAALADLVTASLAREPGARPPDGTTLAQALGELVPRPSWWRELLGKRGASSRELLASFVRERLPAAQVAGR